jgi:diaminohydroxyphosphoribosylaminopyrimidine deaminase/5-amino-6-(5-phosphoribosylamino)uracil reductase
MVGCVLVKDRNIVGEGFHTQFGGSHAEIEAIRDAVNRNGENGEWLNNAV